MTELEMETRFYRESEDFRIVCFYRRWKRAGARAYRCCWWPPGGRCWSAAVRWDWPAGRRSPFRCRWLRAATKCSSSSTGPSATTDEGDPWPTVRAFCSASTPAILASIRSAWDDAVAASSSKTRRKYQHLSVLLALFGDYLVIYYEFFIV